jgi:hypothetical protein
MLESKTGRTDGTLLCGMKKQTEPANRNSLHTSKP